MEMTHPIDIPNASLLPTSMKLIHNASNPSPHGLGLYQRFDCEMVLQTLRCSLYFAGDTENLLSRI
jgi:hypothetical protein